MRTVKSKEKGTVYATKTIYKCRNCDDILLCRVGCHIVIRSMAIYQNQRVGKNKK